MKLKNASNNDLESVASEVIKQLLKAGVYAFCGMDRGEDPGVEVKIDQIDDDAQGVYLEWYCGAQLTKLAIEALQEKHYNDPSIYHLGEIKTTKLNEISDILSAVGIQTEDPQNDYAPYTLRVCMADSS